MGSPIRYIQLLLIPMLLSLGACNDADVPENNVEKISDFLGVNEKPVYYDSATAEDVADHVVDCNGNSDKICITICHLPPGNPDNSHSKKLPLQASLAHMGHGDFLGDCKDLPESEPELPTPTPTPVPDPDLPVWCLENIEIDADCDGFTDDDNQPLY